MSSLVDSAFDRNHHHSMLRSTMLMHDMLRTLIEHTRRLLSVPDDEQTQARGLHPVLSTQTDDATNEMVVQPSAGRLTDSAIGMRIPVSQFPAIQFVGRAFRTSNHSTLTENTSNHTQSSISRNPFANHRERRRRLRHNTIIPDILTSRGDHRQRNASHARHPMSYNHR